MMNIQKFIEKNSELLKNIDIDLVKKVVVFDETSSTNTKAKEIARTGEEGALIIARTQTKGRGRFNRIWHSPEGGLYFSVILKPNISPDKISLLPLIAALAVSKTINLNYNLKAKIKWPNDVRINGKKVAGILLESEIDGKEVRYVILGFGINLNIDVNQFPKELKNAVTSASQELGTEVDYQKFLEKLLSVLDGYYKMFLHKEIDILLKEWKELSDTLNRRVKIVISSEEITGTAHDIDKSGFLIVTTDSGDYKKIMSGDCIYIEN